MSSRYTSKHGLFEFFDAAGHTIQVGPGPGDTSIDGIQADNVEIIDARDRGVHDGFVAGPDLVQAVSITTEIENKALTGGPLGPATVHDWVNKTGIVATYTSFDACGWAIGVRLTMDDGATPSVITLPKFRPIGAITEAPEGNGYAISGTNYVKPVFT